MVRLLFLCLVLLGCHTARTCYEYKEYHIDEESRADLDEDFGRYLKHLSELDSTKDGYYLVYDLAVDAVEPSAYLFFYDIGDSITICPFNNGPSNCKIYEFRRDDFPRDNLESAQPLYPEKGASLREKIYGYRKEASKKRYYRLIQMDACRGDVACMDNWRQSIQENIEQYNLNSRLFNRFAYLIEVLVESDALENALQTGKFSDEVFEKFLRNHQERLSRLEREYKELMDERTDSLSNPH